MYPIIVVVKFCWSVHPKVVRLGMYAHSKQKSYSHTTFAVSHQVYVGALLVQHLYSVFFQCMVWYGPPLETLDAEKAEKLVKIY